MLTKRIIPCLDIRDGRTVKGINFENIIDAGNPVELATRYCQEGADELVFLDITATIEKRKTLSNLVTKIAQEINIPFTVGGGISTLDDVRMLIDSGADKVSINSSAVRNPDIIDILAKEFGSQCIVVAIDAKKNENKEWKVHIDGGRKATDLEVLLWSKEVVKRGAGEILLTAMNNDGTKNGFALDITQVVAVNVTVPVIASGGAGSINHFVEVFLEGKADAALAASVFHFNEFTIKEVKDTLSAYGVTVRNNY
jgi:imidazole glycerol-phosphate synthase subunit HisF